MTDRGPVSPAECRELLLDGRARLEALLGRIDDHSRDGDDGWSAKDHVLHLAHWQRRVADWFEQASAGDTPERPEPGFSFDQTDELNDRDWLEGRDVSAAEAREAFIESFERVVRVIEGMSDGDLNEPTRFSWLGFEARDAIAGNSYGHYGDHREALERLAGEWEGRR